MSHHTQASQKRENNLRQDRKTVLHHSTFESIHEVTELIHRIRENMQIPLKECEQGVRLAKNLWI